MRLFPIALLSLLSTFQLNAQTVQVVSTGTNTSLRGLSVVSDKIIWVSGSNGTIGRSLDSGKTWKWIVVSGFEHSDFRDIEGFDETSALIMGTGCPAYILRTDNAGKSWMVTFEARDSGMFLDGMYFWNPQSGIVIGDPIQHHFYIARTFDGGLHWRGIPTTNYPIADSGEVCFAASGTNIHKLSNSEACFVSGGLKSRLFIQNTQLDIPFETGKASAGANSIAVKNPKTIVVVGGDYLQPLVSYKNCFITKNAGKTWVSPAVPPTGYMSCVEYLGKSRWLSCGAGVDYSSDEGNNWKVISTAGYNVCQKSQNGKAVFLAGEHGAIAKVIF